MATNGDGKTGEDSTRDIAVAGHTAMVTGTAGDVDTGEGAHGHVVAPSGKHAYITNLYGNDVAVLDLDTLTVVARIPVGAKPNGISFSPVTTPEQPATTLDLPVGLAAEPAEHSEGTGQDGGSH